MENFVIGVHGVEFRVVIEYAVKTESELQESDIEELFESASDLDRIAEVSFLGGQWFLTPVALTEEEPHDIVMGVGADSGEEASRKLAKRWYHVVAGRNLALLRTTCRIDDLAPVIEKWEASARKYERRKGETGQRLKLTGELKIFCRWSWRTILC